LIIEEGIKGTPSRDREDTENAEKPNNGSGNYLESSAEQIKANMIANVRRMRG